MSADEAVARMRADDESDWPERLLKALGSVPLIPESALENVKPCPQRILSPLDSSELRVLGLLSHGLRCTEAADVLGLSVWTVKQYSKRACQKLRAKTATQAVAEAVRQGWLD